MATAFTPGLQISERTKVRRLRELPVKGEILFKKGESVASDWIVARAYLQGDLYILRVAERLGIEAFEVLEGLQSEVGSEVVRGDLLCEHAGLFGLLKTRYEAPAAGTIEFVAEKTGHIGLRVPPQQLEVDAYIPGEVVAIEEGKAITIETEASLVQGIFGVGGERQGRIKNLEVALEDPITEKDIPEKISGTVLVGGNAPTAGALARAASLGAVGFIAGSIDDKALADYLGYDIGIALTGDEDISMTLIVTEGFGHIAMAERTSDLFKKCEGLEASLNGATQVRAGAVRPEIIVSKAFEKLPYGKEEVKSAGGLEVGSRIKIIRFPYFGMNGTVVDLPHDAERIETGARTRVLKAKLDEGDVVTVPRANVELF